MGTLKCVCILYFICLQLLDDFVSSCEESNIRNLNDLDLRSPQSSFDYYITGTYLNDVDLSTGWYRAIYNGWQYTMTDYIPEYEKCSAYWPIHLKDEHPSLDNLTETPTEVTACMKDNLQPCRVNYQIKVRKCAEEIQYYLQPTEWFSAFCFNKSSELPVEVTPAPVPEEVTFGNVVVEPELHFNQVIDETAADGTIWYEPYIEFRCQFNTQAGLFYTVVWDIDTTNINGKFDETLVTMGPSKDIDKLKLHEDVLLSKHIPLGVHIRCAVSASAAINGLRTPSEFSVKFYAGIKVLSNSIYLDKERSATIQMTSTVPIGCRYYKKPSGKVPRFLCKENMQIFVDDSNPFDCEKMRRGRVLNEVPENQGNDNQMCAKPLNTMTAEENLQPDIPFNFTIVTSDHTYEDQSEFVLKLQFGAFIGHKIWADYLFPDIKVYVQDMKRYEKKTCTARNDPHMKTFDGYHYEQQELGAYIMYQHTQKGIEVQHITKKCGSATCTCGVAVSAGQDIFMINRCGSVPFLGFSQCGDGGILQVVRINDLLYKVYTPIGTRVEINLSGSDLMNVDIYMAPKDMNNVIGLCGQADDNKANDLKHRYSGKVSPLSALATYDRHHKEFAASWRVKENSDENLFSPTFKKRDKWSHQNGVYCMCNGNTGKRSAIAICSSTQYLNCTIAGSITKKKCHIEGRRKRNVGNHSDKEVRRLLALMAQRNNDIGRKKREERKTVKITSEAKDFCAGKIGGSLVMTAYSNMTANEDENIITSWCAFDLSADNRTNWADIHVEALNEGVKTMMELQPTYVANHTEEVELFLKNTCPMNCSSRGNCSELGVCSCDTYYHGPDCSIDERDALNILDIQGGGVCDIADGEECQCFYVRSDRIQENFTCSVNTSKILTNGDIEFLSLSTLEGGFEDIFTGICCVPLTITGSEDVFVARYGVKISNDGNNFGNEENVYVFDSKCQEAEDNSDGSKTFDIKEKHCFIEGFCFADNEMSSTGCLACQSSAALYKWTDYNPCKNGGNCSGEANGYTCSCVNGYGGMNCEYEVNECESGPCRNGGVCTDKFNGYTCECSAGFTGTNCETDIYECASHPCQNGGMCTDLVNMFSCSCTDGYEGTLCEIETNECESNPCQNSGNCSDQVNQYTCSCMEGYYGAHCETRINDCVSNPCQNGANCTDLVDGRMCKCLDGFNGTNCEININDCKPNPCQNGGSCVDLVNGFICTCVDGFEGAECDININECASGPCRNGGSCKDLINGYTCECAAGFYDTNCESEIDECLPQPCHNNGTCKDQINGYLCECVAGFKGTDCESGSSTSAQNASRSTLFPSFLLLLAKSQQLMLRLAQTVKKGSFAALFQRTISSIPKLENEDTGPMRSRTRSQT